MPFTQDDIGYFTSRIPILDEDEEIEVLSLYTLDSTDRMCIHPDLPGESCIGTRTVEWLGRQ